MKTETIRDWAIAALALIAILGICSSDFDDKLIDETVKEETISQQKREQLAHQEELRKLSIRAEYMTGFKSK